MVDRRNKIIFFLDIASASACGWVERGSPDVLIALILISRTFTTTTNYIQHPSPRKKQKPRYPPEFFSCTARQLARVQVDNVGKPTAVVEIVEEAKYDPSGR